MTNPLRPDAPPERDHVSPGDLLSDDPDESVDPRMIWTRTQSDLGPGTCAALRERLRRGDTSPTRVADALDIDAGEQTLSDHYRGRCAHDIDAPPVRYDHSDRVWRTDPATETNE